MELKKGYKQTEVGIIPEDWEVKSLGKLCSYQNGTSLERYFNNQDGYLVISIGNYSAAGRFVETGNFIDKIHSKALSKFVLDKNNLTMLLNDKTSVGTIIGRVLLIEADDKYIFNQRTMRITTKNQIVPRFLYYQINGERTHQDIITAAKPGTQIYINTDDVIGLNIPLPPTKAEQTAIATALSDADALIQSLEKLIAKKRLIKQGAMQELLKPKEGWVVKKLGEIFSITAGGDLRKDEFSSVNDERYCYPIYSNALTNAGLYGYCSSYDHHANCITVTARGTVGFANSRDHKFSAIGRLLILKPIEKLNCVFIAEYINLRVEFANESTGVPQLTAPQISKYEVVIPDSTEQTRIATILADMDAEISALETKLSKYKMVKQGMMQNLLTGKIRLV